MLLIMLLQCALACAETPKSTRSEKAISSWTPKLETGLEARKLSLGAPVFFRILKTKGGEAGTGELQAFVENSNGIFIFFKSWDICTYSGALGPKLKQGDRQSAEGFYFVTPAAAQPQFELSSEL